MRKYLRFLLLPLFLVLTGCKTYDLGGQWKPLEQLVERPEISSKDRTLTTVGKNVYLANLRDFLDRNPPETVSFDAIMLHEQIHAKRQYKVGLYKWLARYLYDTEFMWKEEQLGWWAQIRKRQQSGLLIVPEAIARSLSRYKNGRGAMVDYEDALDWVYRVISGQWQPAEEDKWSLPPEFVQQPTLFQQHFGNGRNTCRFPSLGIPYIGLGLTSGFLNTTCGRTSSIGKVVNRTSMEPQATAAGGGSNSPPSYQAP